MSGTYLASSKFLLLEYWDTICNSFSQVNKVRKLTQHIWQHLTHVQIQMTHDQMLTYVQHLTQVDNIWHVFPVACDVSIMHACVVWTVIPYGCCP